MSAEKRTGLDYEATLAQRAAFPGGPPIDRSPFRILDMLREASAEDEERNKLALAALLVAGELLDHDGTPPTFTMEPWTPSLVLYRFATDGALLRRAEPADERAGS